MFALFCEVHISNFENESKVGTADLIQQELQRAIEAAQTYQEIADKSDNQDFKKKADMPVPSGQAAQDIVDKYTKTTSTKSGIVKRKVPARVHDPLDMFIIVRSLDDGNGNAITQRTDNQAWIEIPVFILPLDTDVGDTLCLNVSLNFYRETYFTARFMSLTLPDTCSFLVEQSMNFPFSVPLSWIPASSFINGSIGFKLTKKVAGDNFEATHKITSITAADITLQGISDGKTVVFDRALLPYVRLPALDGDIINLQLDTEFRLVTHKIS